MSIVVLYTSSTCPNGARKAVVVGATGLFVSAIAIMERHAGAPVLNPWT